MGSEITQRVNDLQHGSFRHTAYARCNIKVEWNFVRKKCYLFLKDELKCAFTGKNFWISTAIIVVCYLSFSVPSWVGSADWGTEFHPSALQQSLEALVFGGVILLLPFCAAGAYAISQVDDIQSNFLLFKIARSSYRKYALGKILSAAASGAAVIAITFVLHAVIWNWIALPYDPVAYPYHELPFKENGFFVKWHLIEHALPIYLYIFFAMGLFGAVWALIALAVSVWVPDKILAITIPACFYQLWAGGIYRFLFGWQLPTPSTMFLISADQRILTQSLIMYGLHALTAIILYRLGLKRWVQHA